MHRLAERLPAYTVACSTRCRRFGMSCRGPGEHGGAFSNSRFQGGDAEKRPQLSVARRLSSPQVTIMVARVVQAQYEHGVLRPTERLASS